METWQVYIIQSSDDSLYTGIALDAERRLLKHNSGKGAKRTRRGRPWHLVHLRTLASKGAALKLEYAIKQLGRPAKLKLIQTNKNVL